MNVDREMIILRNNIIILRREYHLTKAEMARIMGVCPESLTKIEKGLPCRRLNCDVLLRLMEHFGLKGEDLFRPLEGTGILP